MDYKQFIQNPLNPSGLTGAQFLFGTKMSSAKIFLDSKGLIGVIAADKGLTGALKLIRFTKLAPFSVPKRSQVARLS